MFEGSERACYRGSPTSLKLLQEIREKKSSQATKEGLGRGGRSPKAYSSLETFLHRKREKREGLASG